MARRASFGERPTRNLGEADLTRLALIGARRLDGTARSAALASRGTRRWLARTVRAPGMNGVCGIARDAMERENRSNSRQEIQAPPLTDSAVRFRLSRSAFRAQYLSPSPEPPRDLLEQSASSARSEPIFTHCRREVAQQHQCSHRHSLRHQTSLRQSPSKIPAPAAQSVARGPIPTPHDVLVDPPH